MYLLRLRKFRAILMLLSMLFLVIGGGCTTKTATNEAGIYEQEGGNAVVRGKTVDVNDDYLVVQYAPNKRLRLHTGDDMTLEGFSSLRAVKMLQPVEVSYRVEAGRNIITSITKLEEVG